MKEINQHVKQQKVGLVVIKVPYIKASKRKRLQKKLQKDEQLARNNPDLYTNYRSKGYTHSQAIQQIKKTLSQTKAKRGTKSLMKLQQRYQLGAQKPGVTAISIEDIKRTKAVQNWIDEKVQEGQIIDVGYKLKFPKNEEIMRY